VPVAIHGLEHLGATDRGVALFRTQLRRGMRAVQAGDDPAGLCRDADMVIPTYCNDTIVRWALPARYRHRTGAAAEDSDTSVSVMSYRARSMGSATAAAGSRVQRSR
jgi:hypothetical protein